MQQWLYNICAIPLYGTLLNKSKIQTRSQMRFDYLRFYADLEYEVEIEGEDER